jgi:Uma2 family endonuclease
VPGDPSEFADRIHCDSRPTWLFRAGRIITGGEKMSTITVADYERMIESGELPEDPHVELIDGRLVRKMTKGRGHSAGSYKARHAIERVLPAGWHARAETPVRIPERDSMPEPDVSAVRGEADDYLDLDPGPDDVGLLVEVADSSVAEDRALAGTYAGGGIAVYWIVNVADGCVEVHADPVGGVYRSRRVLREGESVELVLDGRVVARIAVADLLPRR